MKNVFGDLLVGPKWHVTFFFIFLILGCATVFTTFSNANLHSLVAFATFAALVGFLLPPILRVAHMGHKHVVSVCVWSTVLLIAFATAFYFWFYTVGSNTGVTSDRVLNLVPVASAIVAAILGWYVHYQYSAKNHRTNNAFTMVMQMRTSSEFMRKHEMVIKHFPANSVDIPDDYRKYFASSSLRDLAAIAPAKPIALSDGSLKGDELRNAESAYQVLLDAHEVEVEKATAIYALRYIINYFEFMSAGVKAKDLDEDLLLDTVSEIVIGYFDRSASFIQHVRSDAPAGGGQPLAYVCLEKFVKDFKEKIVVQKRDREDKIKKGES